MITKIMICSIALGCLSALASMFDRGHGRLGDGAVQLPPCDEGGGQCAGIGTRASVSTDRFLAMLATH